MSTPEKEPERRPLALRIAPWLGCVAVITFVLLATTQWSEWASSRRVQTTQNAYVKSDYAVLSARVSGYIKNLPVGDYEKVHAGDLIAQIDDSEYEFAVAAAEANLAKAQANLDNLDGEIAQQRARIKASQANVKTAEVRIIQYKTNPARQAELVRAGALSRQRFETAQADFEQAVSQRDATAAELELAHRSMKVLKGQRAVRQADIDAARAQLETALKNLAYTRIVAPFDGMLNKRHVQVGSLIGNGAQIVAIVPDSQSYVVANYKETQLAHVKAGQPVRLTVDGLPGKAFRGRVSEIAPMSGAESALLPADNASGNFTKVVQRIPVRIELEPGQNELSRLRAGMSVETRIDTRGEIIAPYAAGMPKTAQLAAGPDRTGG
ncbi:HlyD family secretion protein [Klebsiella pneumoniae]|uniref:HlyD family secretion protein n=1 Tax=Klebsiella pneumoniae TaxID=573 RepID=UPI000F8186FD|nr:HlyD family secretion protein [Klebsiella pneumoniae]ELA1311003.1 HlyD family secretion protein [Klebsiella pneumoniae]MBZ1696268.1 HlyD family secretion protein [Klebsiella pneumoniae]MCP6273951.1 HlyD family secretion protein [Klebsiella pneumoniae]MEA4669404.1 HlyD family secretion protein [Klebsiella pneumoniae]MEE2241865.1 HlyD family secretion protein [Klebsiella pneumoniae]